MQERLLNGVGFLRFFRQPAVGPAECGEHLLGMGRVEKIDQRGIVPLDQIDFQFGHKPCHRHPEIVAYHEHALDAHSVTLPERFDQLSPLLLATSV